MNTNTLKNKLENMEGKTFQYASQIHYVQKVMIDETTNKFQIKTNINTYERPIENLETFLKYWKQTDGSLVVLEQSNEKQSLAVFFEQENNQCTSIVNNLNEMTEKVKTNKDYIPQAKAVNDIAKTWIALAKTKMELIKTLNHSHLK